MADQVPLGIGLLFNELENLVHLYDVAFHPSYLVDTGETATPVRQALELNDKGDRRRDLSTDARDWQPHASHGHHLFEPFERITRRVGVNGRHRTLVTRVHRLQHVESFVAATLTNDDAIWTHTQCVLDQVTLTDLALPFGVGRTRFHPTDMQLLQLQLGCVFDRYQTLILGDAI